MLGLPRQLMQRMSWGQKLGSSVAMESPASAELMHFGQLIGLDLSCSSSWWGSLQRRQRLFSEHLCVGCSRLPTFSALSNWGAVLEGSD